MKALTFCQWPGCSQIATDGIHCGTHGRMFRKSIQEENKPPKQFKPIAKMSKRLVKETRKYNNDHDEFLRGKFCAVYPFQIATQVHHMKGRKGYADKWARARGITLLNDKRYWLPVSDDGHDWINNNHAEAVERGFCLPRNITA